ncbi:TSUP family transporter [Frisingicoccus sp.]|uniref:TSUP family transporter n=1 Tax=Frisingicoccus sp. TaxID=1918627 RepID=UPI003AB609F1
MDAFTLSLPLLCIICFFVFLAGFVDAAAGGGGLISLPAYIATGMPAHVAYGCNKFSSACGTTLASLRFFRNRAMDVQIALLAAVGSFAGSGVAARIVLLLDDAVLKRIVIIFLPVAALVIFLNRGYGETNQSDSLSKRRKFLLALVIGLLIGFYDGMVGPGTGTFAIIAFSILMKYDLKTASGNAKILNLASNYASLITYALSGNILWTVAVPAAVCNVLGSYFGSGMALKKGAAFIRPMILVVMILLMIKIVSDIVL